MQAGVSVPPAADGRKTVKIVGQHARLPVHRFPLICFSGSDDLVDWYCRWAEKLAVQLGTPLDLPSRLGSAMVQVLSTAVGRSGHTYLPWSVVAQEAERLLQSTGEPFV